ncbi:PIN-like domain-containing protein [Sphingobium sp. SCG-1]|uniref:PIN-like domain-containing protein n=1 Tax=Sphingobium sp. SCG-1 TaxID=2072936 RepID=UPI0011AB8B13|nr:PIN-like domain-containing protein [Sphingobium sp. SCG-1]
MRTMVSAWLSQSAPQGFKGRLARRRPGDAAGLFVPLESEDSRAFAEKAGRLLDDSRTHIFIDTSFLMWMIRIGEAPRRELIEWMETTAAGRLHVPVWSAHELYRHHVEGTVARELTSTLEEFERLAKKSFDLIWPLLSEPLAGAASAQAQRNEAREAMRSTRAVIEHARHWGPSYARHAATVIDFANRHAMRNSGVFDYFESIEGIAEARFTGRVPPGFQDRNKTEVVSGKASGSDKAPEVVGSNRWGDLIFWKEILDEARMRRANAIVILTKDVKNDWRMGGTLPAAGGDGTATGEPPAHPTLVFEAAQRAGVRDLMLLDHRRLSTLFDVRGLPGEAFIAAAKPPPPTTPKTEAELRTEETERTIKAREAVRASDARKAGVLFVDPAGLAVSEAKLRRALVETKGAKRQTVAGLPAAIALLERAAADNASLARLLRDGALAGLDHIGLVGVARHLGLEALDRAILESAVTELATLVEQLPPATAGFVYFGLLAAAYLESDGNAFRATPGSPAMQRIFGYQGCDFASLPIATLRARTTRAERWPVYLPDPEAPQIVVRMEVDTDLAAPLSLRALWLGDHQLLTPAQGDPALRLQMRFADGEARPELLLDHIAELYALPRAQIVAETGVTTAFSLEEYSGFKAPSSVFEFQSAEAE